MKPRILILCTHNAVRSQIAEGYMKKFLAGQAEIFSAGLEARGVHPLAISVMHEDGVSISNQKSKTIDELPAGDFQYILTVCDHAREFCPVFPGRHVTLHQSFPDPSTMQDGGEQSIEAFRAVRDQIKLYCTSLAPRLVPSKPI